MDEPWFLTMGLFVGNLTGLSATSVVSQMIGIFFALAGGSIIALLKKLEKEERKVAYPGEPVRAN